MMGCVSPYYEDRVADPLHHSTEWIIQSTLRDKRVRTKGMIQSMPTTGFLLDPIPYPSCLSSSEMLLPVLEPYPVRRYLNRRGSGGSKSII
jgi:hypothetical protein